MPYSSSSGGSLATLRSSNYTSTSSVSSYRNSPGSSYLGSSTGGSSSYLSSSRTNSFLSHASSGSSASSSRSSSLDRTSSRDVSSIYRPSSLLPVNTTSYRTISSSIVTSRPPRSSSCVKSSASTTSLTSLPISKRFQSPIRSGLKVNTGVSSRSGCDAIHDHLSPVLTNYRSLSDSTSSGLGLSRYSTYSHRGSIKNLDVYSLNSLNDARSSTGRGSTSDLLAKVRDIDSGLSSGASTSSSGSSSPSLSTGSVRSHGSKLGLDENSNCTTSYSGRHKYDANRNVCSSSSSSKGSDEEADTTSTGSNSSRCSSNGSPVSSSPRQLRFGSTEDLSLYSYGRRRRASGQASTSGYSSDASNSSSSGNYGGSNYRRSKQESEGLSGLKNLGNTCFMNSVLQCLSNTRPLMEYSVQEKYISDINVSTSSMKGALIKSFASLLQSMRNDDSNNSAVNPQAFKSQIQKFAPRFMGYSQQDAQEFLRYLLQGLHEDVNRLVSKPTPIHTDIDDNLSDNQKASESWRRYLRFDDSKIVDLFVGQLKSTLRCTSCGHTSVTFDPFWDLSLPLPKQSGSVKLQNCFELFTSEEVLNGDEKPTCAKCKTRRKCTKSFSIQKFPKILVIHLKRFSPSEKYRAKLTTTVDFPLYNLDLSAFAVNSNQSQNCAYNLYGVSNHSGTVFTGHYTAFCKHPYSGDWYDYNDVRVTKVSQNSVVSSEAYVLFYEQVSHSSRL
ncbi:hypothetical protein CHUAL_002542 [Chamberlinius hualienensis]